MEKYIYCLNKWGEDGEKELKAKYGIMLPDSIRIQITNPQGFVIVGRSSGFNEQQRNDLELIRRQNKNIIDILTYDEIREAIQNVIDALQIHN